MWIHKYKNDVDHIHGLPIRQLYIHGIYVQLYLIIFCHGSEYCWDIIWVGFFSMSCALFVPPLLMFFLNKQLELELELEYHRRLDWLLNPLFRRKSRKTSKLRVNVLCEGNPPVTDGFPSQKASNAENVSIWWRHHGGDRSRVPYIYWLNTRRINSLRTSDVYMRQ